MSESALLRAVRDRIRAHAGFQNRQVNVEIDERAPALAGDLYVIVWPGGIEPGPTHNTGHGAAGTTGVIDKVYGVNVTMAIRSPRKPRDRQRELLTGEQGEAVAVSLASFQIHQQNIEKQIDRNQQTISAANVFIAAETTTTDNPFIELLKFAGVGPVRVAPAELFSSFGNEPGLIRTIRFRGARRIENRP
jgi:hypothetical protein